ncbi:MAG: TatD family hydrolase [Pseudoalteromonas sp.]
MNSAVELGCYFSIGPAMIHSERAKKVISWLPKERILLETDGPFAKVKGRPVYPSDVTFVSTYLSELWEKSIEEVNELLKLNLKELVS